ncbi:MAG: ATP-binding cassette domain-containing protein [Flavobacteriales bacterium]
MLTVSNLSLQFGKRILFDDVDIQFTKGNCYGIIGANGAGKSTFLKILSKTQEPTTGHVILEPDKRISVLEQNHFAYDAHTVLDTVVMGDKKRFDIKNQMDALYAKPDFSEADGIRAGELGVLFEEMGGWNAESDAATLLSDLGVAESEHPKFMRELDNRSKVRVLLAQALFGDPDVLILDEPTNDLDVATIDWLEGFLADYEHTVIVVSHDRHFLDSVCTHICDIDYGQINTFTGNYSFWHQASQLATRQRSQQNRKAEEKKKELEAFIRRFSSNVAKARQTTARKKMLDKLDIAEIKPSTRRYPAILFECEREAGDQILECKGLTNSQEGQTHFIGIDLNLKRGDKVALLSSNSLATTAFYQIISGADKPDCGTVKWGVTTKHAYIPIDNSTYFQTDESLVDWLRQYASTDVEKHEEYLRGFLGKMLFSGEEALKSTTVLSGGEKMRCMLSRVMLLKPNVLLLDEPTNHLDLESISALNQALQNYTGTLILTSHDRELVHTVCNRMVEIGPQGMIDRHVRYDDYLADEKFSTMRKQIYA